MPLESDISCPTGADLMSHGLTFQQKAAVSAIINKPLAVVDCLAGAGKTRLLTEVIRLKTQAVSTEEYILVAVPNKPMAHRLCNMLQKALPDIVVAPTGVIWKDGEPADLLSQFLEEKRSTLVAMCLACPIDAEDGTVGQAS